MSSAQRRKSKSQERVKPANPVDFHAINKKKIDREVNKASGPKGSSKTAPKAAPKKKSKPMKKKDTVYQTGTHSFSQYGNSGAKKKRY